jgi:O-6-methylguanine DNA methyltransferase
MEFTTNYQSPFGNLLLKADDIGIIALQVNGEITIQNEENKLLVEAKKQLEAYFKKKLKIFDLPINFRTSSGSDFMIKVWTELTNIPFGTTVSYLDLARKIATDKHTRAVGMANGKNPIPIIVPCHRVIGSNGSLTGYALGLEMKKKLLDHETDTAKGIQSILFDHC